ncbi:DUF4271 domain-containing protein [Parabacteroides sp. AM08-6]|uniref:DUF4271 domain-containing protein n=1 Tax=Parabacteroides sp. AM08-6 TaxID=2292053 RepID=UPI000EFF5A3B|nr:DUF4271 domain-containing protein [Parabacteroides sp. AM08-6]RHJ84805.1 DUF4271 domain-containing protein [Parabacteroides sp. AM08-6]
MDLFEGYVGIRLWDGQLVDDIIFSLLLALLIVFAIIFRTNFRLFVKMLKDVAFVKERPNMFDEAVRRDSPFFRNFMVFQTLFLCSITFFVFARIRGFVPYPGEKGVLYSIGIAFFVLFLFYQFKQFCYYLLGTVFADPEPYRLWKTNYNAIIGTWGCLLYIPVLWLVFVGTYLTIPILLFCILYILCRFVIIYKTIRIFHTKSSGLLYISLYLCTQEILPLVFLYEGMVYLYNFIETSTLWH